jgi:hypothetical protein
VNSPNEILASYDSVLCSRSIQYLRGHLGVRFGFSVECCQRINIDFSGTFAVLADHKTAVTEELNWE